MNRVSPYLKMRVLGAIEFAPGNTVIARIHHVSGIVFTEDNDLRYQFTWRTIQTWYSRYKKDGITTMHPRVRSDKGLTRKCYPPPFGRSSGPFLLAFGITTRSHCAVLAWPSGGWVLA